MSTKKISRRDFLKVAGISAAAIGLTACGGSSSTAASTTGSAGSAAASAESATFSVTADVTGDRAPYVERFAELISDKTGGRYQANVIAAGSLGNGSDMAQMLQMGTLDVLMSDDMTIDGVLDGALGFAWLPGLVADYDEADKYYLKGWIADEVAKIMEQNSLIRISSYCNGFRQVGNIVRPVTEMSDLAGLKIRTPSVASVVSFYEKCGALPVMIAGSEVLNALQTGTVDGLDNAVFNYTNQGILDVITHITYPLRYIEGKYHRKVELSLYDDLIDELFRTIIEKDLALEVNSSGLRQEIGRPLPDEPYLRRYYDLGGRKLSFGSDAHRAEDLGKGIPECRQMAKRIGFTETVTFRNRKPIVLSLEDEETGKKG